MHAWYFLTRSRSSQYFADTLVQIDASLDRGMVEVVTDVCEAIDKVCLQPIPHIDEIFKAFLLKFVP